MSERSHIKIVKVDEDSNEVTAVDQVSKKELTLKLSKKLSESKKYPAEGKEYWAFVNDPYLNWFGPYKDDGSTPKAVEVPEPKEPEKKEAAKVGFSDLRAQSIVLQTYSKVAANLLKIHYETNIEKKTKEEVFEDFKWFRDRMFNEHVERKLMI